MTLAEAIEMALEYEHRVRDTYAKAMQESGDEVGRRVFGVLAREEQDHVNYLNERLAEWKKTGRVAPVALGSILPSIDKVRGAAAELRIPVSKEHRETNVEHLRSALELEEKTSRFYRSLVAKLDREGQSLFARFVEIEEGHVAIVQAELDAVTGEGYWFDIQEFGLESA